jgi:hypothetical protein
MGRVVNDCSPGTVQQNSILRTRPQFFDVSACDIAAHALRGRRCTNEPFPERLTDNGGDWAMVPSRGYIS